MEYIVSLLAPVMEGWIYVACVMGMNLLVLNSLTRYSCYFNLRECLVNNFGWLWSFVCLLKYQVTWCSYFTFISLKKLATTLEGKDDSGAFLAFLLS